MTHHCLHGMSWFSVEVTHWKTPTGNLKNFKSLPCRVGTGAGLELKFHLLRPTQAVPEDGRREDVRIIGEIRWEYSFKCLLKQITPCPFLWGVTWVRTCSSGRTALGLGVWRRPGWEVWAGRRGGRGVDRKIQLGAGRGKACPWPAGISALAALS